MNISLLATNLVNLFVGVVETFLGLRFILKLFGANPASDFVGWIYDMSAELLTPFRGIFPTETIEREYVIEFSTIFAMIIYALFGLLAIMAINAMSAPATSSSKKKR